MGWILSVDLSVELGLFIFTQWSLHNKRTLMKPKIIALLFAQFAALGLTLTNMIIIIGNLLHFKINIFQIICNLNT